MLKGTLASLNPQKLTTLCTENWLAGETGEWGKGRRRIRNKAGGKQTSPHKRGDAFCVFMSADIVLFCEVYDVNCTHSHIHCS